MRRAAEAVAAAASWAKRLRPSLLVVAVVLFAGDVLLDLLKLEAPLAVRILVVVLVVAFYVVPWLVTVVRSFAAGYRGSEGEL